MEWEERIQAARERRDHRIEKARREFVSTMLEAVEDGGRSITEVARWGGMSRPYVSQELREARLRRELRGVR